MAGGLHAYLGGAVKTLGGVPEVVGGVADVLRDIKRVSSLWVHETIKSGVELDERFLE